MGSLGFVLDGAVVGERVSKLLDFRAFEGFLWRRIIIIRFDVCMTYDVRELVL